MVNQNQPDLGPMYLSQRKQSAELQDKSSGFYIMGALNGLTILVSACLPKRNKKN